MMGRDASSVIILAVVLVIIAHVAKLCECGNSSTTTTGCIEKERKALLQFKSMFDDPSHLLSSWNGPNCCQWNGISCHPITRHVLKLKLNVTPCYLNYSDREYQYITKTNCMWSAYRLKLKAQNVNPSLLQLEYLNYLDLSGNYFNLTSIPMFLGSMKRLEYLSLSDADFGGRIPHNLGNLDLSSNALYWEEDINWISQLQSLHHLDMSDVNLGKAHNVFQVLNMLPSLSHVLLIQCSLFNLSTPRQPISVTNNLSRVEVLNLAGNYFEGPMLNNAFQNMTSIRFLDISYNSHLNIVPFWLKDSKNLMKLYVDHCSLDGPFPFVLKNMTSIEILDLSYNALDGSIPHDALQSMTSISFLNLRYNNFTGMEFPLSSFIRNMCHLKLLDLSGNMFQGEAFQGNYGNASSRCINSKLEMLDLSYNDFSGSLPSWFQNLESLRILSLNSNHLNGTIPESLGLLVNLKDLFLSHNNLDGILPNSIGQLDNLQYLDLSNNHFQGVIRKNFGQLVNLRYLGLSKNHFQGVIPTNLGQLVNLHYLALSNNHFQGAIPKNFGQLVNLRYLVLSKNHFQGVIPTNLGNLVNLHYLDLSKNHFQGVIPTNLVQLVNLSHLDLSNNHFQGIIPKNFGQLVNLFDLDLSDNYFHGDVPINIGLHVNLGYLNLAHNNFHGDIDQMNFALLKGLQVLDFSNNHLNGSILEMMKLSQMRNLYHLDFSNNHITGSIIENIGDMMPNLEYLSGANNLVNGSIPNSLCKLELLASLDLSKNNLSGEIPNCWNESGNWYEINLSSNKLSGVFRSSLWSLSTLSWLHLNNNTLQGELPFSEDYSLLELLILDLGENNFSGSIPLWTRNTFSSLQILRLRQNKLNGNIPSQLCQLTSLQILDLANNNLSGSVPPCIGNLTAMTHDKYSPAPTPSVAEASDSRWRRRKDESAWNAEDVKQVVKGREDDYTRNLKLVVNMDLSRNNLVGSIPKEITLLTGLHGLNLSNNHLEGGIPEMIGNMKSLESLDLSLNQLSGSIPNSMSDLSSMGHLNLSYNNLSGPIPGGTQLSTLDDPYIYAGNQYLCGPSLPNKCPNDDSHQVPRSKGDEEEEDKSEKLWFYFVVAIGFASGFWGAIGTLWYNKSWRHTCFRYVEELADNIYVALVIRAEKLKNCIQG